MASVVLEEYELMGDSKYRNYVSAIDKVLKNFEYTSEWADLISALGKLNKVLLNHLKYPVIPRRIVISKRLAQCLHPALPGGVHLKALETYDIVFKCIGTNRLSQELFIYSAGLFPLLGNAAMNVRPRLLDIYENHFVPLAERLRPGLSGFLIGVLSGLEEGSEYHDRTNSLLEKVCDGVEATYFYGCLWKCVLTNPSIRLPAVLFVMSHFNKKQNMEDQLFVIGTNVDILVRALCAAVQDSSVLVQRSVLDLLILGFPMHNSQLIKSDMEQIQTAAIGVVLRRDMSLNRRLYAWLLGAKVNSAHLPQEKSHSSSIASSDSGNINVYFDTYSRDLLIQALRTCLKGTNESKISGIDVRPYRILISLLDKQEIGSAILDDILIEVFRALHHECNNPNKDTLSGMSNSKSSKTTAISSATTQEKHKGIKIELIKTANLLFSTLEPYYIWEYMGILFARACALIPHEDGDKSSSTPNVKLVGEGSPSILEVCELIEFLLEIVSIETYVETQTEHLPELLRHLVTSASEHCKSLSTKELTAVLHLCSRILTKVQPPMLPIASDSKSSSPISRTDSKMTLIHENSSNPSNEESVSLSDDVVVEELNCQISPEEENSKEVKSDTPVSPSVSYYGRENEADFITLKRTPESLLRRSLIHNCVQVFQEFFVKFVSTRIFCDEKAYQCAFKLLLMAQHESTQERSMLLETMLWQCLGKSEERPPSASPPCSVSTQVYNLTLPLVDIVSSVAELTEAYSYASQMLVEFSSFPMYCNQDTGTEIIRNRSTSKENDNSIPEWLQVLLVLASSVGNLELQFVSVSTLLDLITITRSVASETEVNLNSLIPADRSNSSQGTIAVVIIPLIEVGHLTFLDNQTCVYQVIAKQLWDQLGEKSLRYHRRSAELLHQLHSLAPNDFLVEDIIGHYMAQGNEMSQIEGFRRFAVLWHLTRDLPTKLSSVGSIRMYDRCLFIMLDCLQQELGPQRTEVQSWLTHSLQRGDIARLLEPILFILLHPDTARVSVQHISIQKPQKVRLSENEDSASAMEAKIYAISSVEGHVFYHVSDEPRQPAPSNSRNQRRVFALTSIAGESTSEVVTANAGVTDFDLPSSLERGLCAPILLFINPIGGLAWNDDSEASSTADISNARRINVNDLRQEFSFDDMETSVERKDVGEEVIEEHEEPTSREVVEEILSDIIRDVCTKESFQDSNDQIVFEESTSNFKLLESDGDKSKETPEEISVHPLHTHLLLYCQVYDSKRVLYALGILKSILQTNPRLALCTLATSSPSSAQSPRHSLLHNLLARHRRSVFGKGFHSELPPNAVTAFRSSMLLEILLSVCLYFIRSFYPNLAQMRLTEEEISGNREVQLASIELLTLLLSELVPVIKDSGRGFSSYICDLFSRCRVQKALLHCLLSNVYASGTHNIIHNHNQENSTSSSFTEAILEFNEIPRNRKTSNDRVSDYNEAFQICILRLLLVIIILEDEVTNQKGERDTGKSENGERSRINCLSQGSTVRYQQNLPIPSQPMFLTAILCAIKQQQLRHLHRHWLALITSALPFLGKALSQVVITIINQLCQNLEALALLYQQKPDDASTVNEAVGAPVDYVMTLLDGLTTLCHYCVLDSPSQTSTVLTQSPVSTIHHPYMPGVNAGQIITNLINVFTPSVVQKELYFQKDSTPLLDPLLAARRNLLSHLPRIVSALSTMWHAMQVAEKSSSAQQHPCWIMGTPKAIKQRILELLSPVIHHHGVNFMAAVAVAWIEKRKKGLVNSKRVILSASEEQTVLVNLVGSVKVMPVDTLIQTVRQVVKQPLPTNASAVKVIPLEVSMLQFFFSYVQTLSGSVLLESWASLLGLLKEGLQLGLAPPAQFLLLGILNEFVQHAPMLEDKKDLKDLQDITQKLIEAVSSVAGACLEQTTWLRRSLAVRPGPQPDIPDSDSDVDEQTLKSQSETTTDGSKKNALPTVFNGMNGGDSQYSVQALSILAEMLAPMLDVIYVSDEKEKVIPLLNNIMCNVTPYLRNHSQHNVPSFRACSQLLANLSSYQYTRKAWRRDAFELLLDSGFFQMTESCIGFWQTTIDNLMTHDKTTFRDLMSRVTMTQSGSLNLFSSKEQEYEQRAQLLKRVAFVIFSGDVDQYQNFMPEIQERLSESLRLPQVPMVQSQVFFCFRVLLLRMSPHHITCLWPIIITEMVQIFLQIEQELNNDSEEFNSHIRRLSTLDSSWVVSPNNGLNAHNHPAWLQLYLSACKLLDLALALPADTLPQFQMYRWAFVGENNYHLLPNINNNNDSKEDISSPNRKQAVLWSGSGNAMGFLPHITRLARLLNAKVHNEDKVTIKPGHLLLNASNIKSLTQLQPFFNTLLYINQSGNGICSDRSCSKDFGTAASQTREESGDGAEVGNKYKGTLQSIEKIIQKDFLESLLTT